jgi:hypothetical protein
VKLDLTHDIVAERDSALVLHLSGQSKGLAGRVPGAHVLLQGDEHLCLSHERLNRQWRVAGLQRDVERAFRLLERRVHVAEPGFDVSEHEEPFGAFFVAGSLSVGHVLRGAGVVVLQVGYPFL